MVATRYAEPLNVRIRAAEECLTQLYTDACRERTM